MSSVLRLEPGANLVLGTTSELGMVGADFTLECWVWFDELSRADVFYTVDDWRRFAAPSFAIMRETPHMSFYENDTWGNVLIAPHAWNHLAFRYDASAGTQSIVVNGILASALETREPLAASDAPARLAGPSDGNQSMHGFVTEYRIWNSHRSLQEINMVMHTRLLDQQKLYPDLSLYLPLYVAGKRPPSALVNKRNGASLASDGLRWESPPVPAPLNDELPSASRDGLWFGQGTGWVTVPGDAQLDALSLSAFTIEAWVSRATDALADPRMQPVVSRHSSGTGWELRCGDQAVFRIALSDGTYAEATSQMLIPRNRWVHLAGSFDGSVATLLVNGVTAATEVTASSVQPYRGSMRIGASNRTEGSVFSGAVRDVRLWTNACSVAQVSAGRFSSPGPELASELLGDWPLQELNGGETPDRSGYRRHGRIAGPRAPGIFNGSIAFGSYNDEALPAMEIVDSDAVADMADELVVETVQHQELAEKEQRIAELQRERDELQRELDELQATHESTQNANQELRESIDTGGSVAVSLDDFIARTQDQIGRARTQLAGSGATHALGQVFMELKAVPVAGGQAWSFPTAEQLAAGMSASTLSLSFDAQPAADDRPRGMPVPDLTGLTLSPARRVLSALGLRLEDSFEMARRIPGQPDPQGRILRQLPAAGQELATGESVQVFVGHVLERSS